MGPCNTLFMDEISTGLDSSTTFLIVKCMRNFVHMAQGTVLMALLQPAPEVYELFDDIMLLCEGRPSLFKGLLCRISRTSDFQVPCSRRKGDILNKISVLNTIMSQRVLDGLRLEQGKLFSMGQRMRSCPSSKA